MFRNKSKNQTGFTLIELLVSIAIMASLAGLVLANYRQAGTSTEFNNVYYSISQLLHRAQQDALVGDINNSVITGAPNSAWGYGIEFRPLGTEAGVSSQRFVELKSGYNSVTSSYSYTVARDLKVTDRYVIAVSICNSGGGSCAVQPANVWPEIFFTSPHGRMIMGVGTPSGGVATVTAFAKNKIVKVTVTTTDGKITREIIINGVSNRISP